MNILGISALYHDSAACLIRDGEIIAAAQEERFSRRKGDARLPRHAIGYCLEAGEVGKSDLDLVVFYDKPLTKLTRLLSTYTQVAPRGLKSFLMAIPVWLKEKGWVAYEIERHLAGLGYDRPKDFQLAEHHHSHAASAFFPSPYEEAAIITVDGVGEWTTTAIGVGEGNQMRLLFEHKFPHSLGMLYSAFTYFTGFRVNSGEYKLMGLAPYGEPTYVDQIKENLISIREDGSFRLNLDYFGYLDGLTMTNDRFGDLFGGPRRHPEADITQREMDLARSIQTVTEEIMMKIARYARAVTGKRYLCMAGGVALNCVSNGKLLRSGIFDDIWIQPAAGDAGGAQGAALYSWYHILKNPRKADNKHDFVRGSQLGPSFPRDQIRTFLDENNLPYEELEIPDRNRRIAEAIVDEKVIGLCQGRMEFGPRALGNRSILADARSPKMQSFLNLATKFRESFRPFAPIVLEEDAHEYFEAITKSPYMLMVDQVRPERCIKSSLDRSAADMREWVNEPRSDVPAITHVDYSARIQTVDEERSPDLYDILKQFKGLTGSSVLVNTSFNVRSEPIVCTPEDAYVCFMRTGIDMLILDNFVLLKPEQPEWQEEEDWRENFAID
ncbi:MAG: carbamoyltransferase [Planctomycetes bacterium]|nr:carbamoyltransferase [Planctomycetota bacterium]